MRVAMKVRMLQRMLRMLRMLWGSYIWAQIQLDKKERATEGSSIAHFKIAISQIT